LNRRIFTCNIYPQLGRAVSEVEIRHLRVEQHLRILLIGNGREECGIGRLGAASVAPPEIELPSQVETGLVADKVLVIARRRTAVLPGIHVTDRTANLRHLWIHTTAGNTQLGTTLHDSQTCDAQGGICLPGRFDQSVQYGIVEQSPPEAQIELELRLLRAELTMQ